LRFVKTSAPQNAIIEDWESSIREMINKDTYLKNQAWKVRLLSGSRIVAAIDASDL
jgi:hypothetical protein